MPLNRRIATQAGSSNMKKFWVMAAIALLSGVALATAGARSAGEQGSSLTTEYSTYVNANNVLMFVTNSGVFGYDKDRIFGYYQLGVFPMSRSV